MIDRLDVRLLALTSASSAALTGWSKRAVLNIYTRPNLHECVPSRLAVAVAAYRGSRRAGTQAPEHQQATAWMADLSHQVIGPSAEELARRWQVEKAVRSALFWRSWRVAREDISGAQSIVDSSALRRGVLIAFIHAGPWWSIPTALRGLGWSPTSVGAEHLFERTEAGLLGRVQERLRSQYLAAGSFRPALGSWRYLDSILHSGGQVNIAFDIPGEAEISFLGRKLSLADGVARLAAAHKAPVVPVMAVRRGHHLGLDVGTALLPGVSETPSELHQRIAHALEPFVRRAPETVERPDWLLPGGRF